MIPLLILAAIAYDVKRGKGPGQWSTTEKAVAVAGVGALVLVSLTREREG